MKTVGQIRIENLELLIEAEGTLNNLASKLGKSPAQVSQWRNASKDSKTGRPRGIRDTTCRDIEKALGKSEGWMDQEHSKDGARQTRQEVEKKIDRENFDEFTLQLLYFFDGMSLEHKDALLLLANKLHAIDNRNDPRSNPYPVPPNGKRTVKTQARG